MKGFFTFVLNNKFVLLGMLAGFLAGYVYWFYVGCYWGTYPMSSEWWMNCFSGVIAGGFIACLIEKRI